MPRTSNKRNAKKAKSSRKQTTTNKRTARESTASRGGVLRRAAATVAGAFSRLIGRGNGKTEPAKPAMKSRPARREPDIPFDQIENAYSPTQTSLKAPFRASGADHQRDQEFASGTADGPWNAEDRFTNKSGDPRIGTHGRTYEPGEARVARSRADEND